MNVMELFGYWGGYILSAIVAGAVIGRYIVNREDRRLKTELSISVRYMMDKGMQASEIYEVIRRIKE